MIVATVVVPNIRERSSGSEGIERRLTFAKLPRVGEIILVPATGLSPGFEVVVRAVVHRPTTRDDGATVLLYAKLSEQTLGSLED